MRFKLILDVEKQAFGNKIPINYQYESSAIIYRTLAQASEQYSEWLHDNGFILENGKRFKLFNFSWFIIDNCFAINKTERLVINSDTISWIISFLPEKSTEKFIQGIFSNQTFEIGDKKSVVQFHVRSVEVIPSPIFTNEMEFSTMSPICLRCTSENGLEDYISPADERAKKAIFSGLMSRYESFYGKPFAEEQADFDFELLSEPRSVLVKIKADTPEQTRVRGYKCDFRIKTHPELMRIMYESGCGELTSQGFGCILEKKLVVVKS